MRHFKPFWRAPPNALSRFRKTQDSGAKDLSFDDCFEAADNPGFIKVEWKLSWLRKSPDNLDPHEVVTVATETRQVPCDEDEDENDVVEGEAEANDNPASHDKDNDNGGDDSGDDNDFGADDNDEDDGGGCKNVKNDLEHIFLRWARFLLKAHGAFGAFMARLSDALFVPSQADIEFIKFALRKAGLSADQIKSKSWNYYKRRVRRRVPPRKVLEREYLRVINMFAGLLDAKTGKPLFNKKAWGFTQGYAQTYTQRMFERHRCHVLLRPHSR
jgi:hypothetical protein